MFIIVVEFTEWYLHNELFKTSESSNIILWGKASRPSVKVHNKDQSKQHYHNNRECGGVRAVIILGYLLPLSTFELRRDFL